MRPLPVPQARTSTCPNTSEPAWGGDTAHRGFVFPVTCPYAVAYVAVHDDDAGRRVSSFCPRPPS